MATSTRAQEKQSESGARKGSPLTPAELVERTLYRSAIEAVIWGMPAVNAQLMFDAVKQTRGDFNQILFWSQPCDWVGRTSF